MAAWVRFRLPDGDTIVLGAGDVIGRMWTASLRLDDPYVSEAHALVSLRDATLRLLALRGRFLVDGHAVSDCELAVGQTLTMSPESTLVVEAVSLPDEALALQGPGLPRQILGGTCSLFGGPIPRLAPGARPEAAALVWSTGDTWQLRLAGALAA